MENNNNKGCKLPFNTFVENKNGNARKVYLYLKDFIGQGIKNSMNYSGTGSNPYFGLTKDGTIDYNDGLSGYINGISYEDFLNLINTPKSEIIDNYDI